MHKLKLPALLLIFVISSLQIQAQATFPANDVASPKDGSYAFTNATIVKDAQTTLQNATLLIKQGKIVGINVPVPKDAVVVDCKGKFIYPSFIDLFSNYGLSSPGSAGGGEEDAGRFFIQKGSKMNSGGFDEPPPF